MTRALLIIAVLILVACARCTKRPAATPPDVHVTAARILMQRYAASRFRPWHIRVTAAGSDCRVLLLQADIILEDSMVEAMHYGAGSYDTYEGGVQQFLRTYSFRGASYQDASGHVWTYGNLSASEAERLVPCH